MLGKRDCYGQDKSQVVASLEGGLLDARPGGERVVKLVSTPEKDWGCVTKKQVLVSTVAVECFRSTIMGTAPLVSISECNVSGSDLHALL